MKLNLPKSWFESAAQRESGYEIAAGLPARDVGSDWPAEGRPTQRPVPVERLAFRQLVRQLRRERQLTIEELANAAQVSVVELVELEAQSGGIPRPRTVYQLAKYFCLPEKPLLVLAGITTAQAPEVREAAVRYAAHAQPMDKLSKEERQELEVFVKFLSECP